jgi:hypothetical protein
MNVPNSMPQIFISYSRKDIAFARRLAGDLEKAGYNVWWDLTDLRGGDDWPRVIPAAIEASQYVIVVMSPNSAISDWVEKEYTHALELRKKIIPIMLRPSRVPFALNTLNYVNFALGEYADNFKNLLTALGYTGQPPVEPRKSALPPTLTKYGIPHSYWSLDFACAHFDFYGAACSSNFNADDLSLHDSARDVHGDSDTNGESNRYAEPHGQPDGYIDSHDHRDRHLTANTDSFAYKCTV